jgi:2-amino-4-hydroxy-6-hydroxymethyldihydropteridine diphosphokinase
VARSGWYRSAPVDASGPDYLNGAAVIDTALAPLDLLDALLAIEAAQGRKRPYRHAPRTLDLDLLLYGDQVLDTPRLTLPHPRAHLRAFVLWPMAELLPAGTWPGQGLLADLLAGVADQRVERLG